MTTPHPYLFQNLSWEYYFYLRPRFQEHNLAINEGIDFCKLVQNLLQEHIK